MGYPRRDEFLLKNSVYYGFKLRKSTSKSAEWPISEGADIRDRVSQFMTESFKNLIKAYLPRSVIKFLNFDLCFYFGNCSGYFSIMVMSLVSFKSLFYFLSYCNSAKFEW